VTRPPVEDGGVLIGGVWCRQTDNGPEVYGYSSQPDWYQWWSVRHAPPYVLSPLGEEMIRHQLDAQAEVGGDWRNLRPGDQIEVHDSDGPRLCVVTSSIFVDFEMREKLVDFGEVLSVVDEDGDPGLINANTSFRLVWRPMYQTKADS